MFKGYCSPSQHVFLSEWVVRNPNQKVSRSYELYRRRYSTSKVAIDWLMEFSLPHLEAISLVYTVNRHLW